MVQKRRNRHAIKNVVVWYQPNDPKCHSDIANPMCFPLARELVHAGFLAWKIWLQAMNMVYSTGAAAMVAFCFGKYRKAQKIRCFPCLFVELDTPIWYNKRVGNA